MGGERLRLLLVGIGFHMNVLNPIKLVERVFSLKQYLKLSFTIRFRQTTLNGILFQQNGKNQTKVKLNRWTKIS